ncbi:acyl transferase [Aquiflexum gelatinilyticum]|uniref:Acyl transferase n=1 Tax=Aquiflexum gelatinilyticum TaxID=2961943 RepID=A0A9X2T2I2_9BACT|nr:acyl transferase [Aquiflexum gelatinilyticum]MCR9015485.1 acyl transferase [Aquiflexum gelatinilyticum]
MTINKTINYFKCFGKKVLTLDSNEFEEIALELYKFQLENNAIYRQYVKARGLLEKKVIEVKDIPFLPISFFKNHQIVSGSMDNFEDFFSSSGTTGAITSKHYYWSEEFYLKHSLNLFEAEYGNISEYHVLALLPSYLERKGSSLVSMANYFISRSGSENSGFYLYNYQELGSKLEKLAAKKEKVLLLGVTFALIDLLEQVGSMPKNENLIVMETGGMKGRRKEMIRDELHHILKSGFRLDKIHSEYGMTELMSQAYSKGEGIYNLPPCIRVYIRDVNDPFSWSDRSQGGINIIDLANFHSCAFIETQDLGRKIAEEKIEVLGRFDNSEIRGCNLILN